MSAAILSRIEHDDLHRFLSLAVDAALDADDALTREDSERLDKATAVLLAHATAARKAAKQNWLEVQP